MSEPAQKCEIMLLLSKTINKNCPFLFKYPILAVLALGRGNLEFPEFLLKKVL